MCSWADGQHVYIRSNNSESQSQIADLPATANNFTWAIPIQNQLEGYHIWVVPYKSIYEGQFDQAFSVAGTQTTYKFTDFYSSSMRMDFSQNNGIGYGEAFGYASNAGGNRISAARNKKGIYVMSYSVDGKMYYDVGTANANGSINWLQTKIYHGDGNMPNVSLNDNNQIAFAMYNNSKNIYVKYGTVKSDFTLDLNQTQLTTGSNNAEAVAALNNNGDIVVVYKLNNSGHTYQNVGKIDFTAKKLTWTQACNYFCEAEKINGICLNDFGQCVFLMIQANPSKWIHWKTGILSNGALAWKGQGYVNGIVYDSKDWLPCNGFENVSFGKAVITTPQGHALFQLNQDYSMNLLSINNLPGGMPLCIAR